MQIFAFNIKNQLFKKFSTVIKYATQNHSNHAVVQGCGRQTKTQRIHPGAKNVNFQYYHTFTTVSNSPWKIECRPSSIYIAYTIEICSLYRRLCGISEHHHFGISCWSIIWASDCEWVYHHPETTTQQLISKQSSPVRDALKISVKLLPL